MAKYWTRNYLNHSQISLDQSVCSASVAGTVPKRCRVSGAGLLTEQDGCLVSESLTR